MNELVIVVQGSMKIEKHEYKFSKLLIFLSYLLCQVRERNV